MRSGDTPADERRVFARRPADILITTPESLFLLLTSRGPRGAARRRHRDRRRGARGVRDQARRAPGVSPRTPRRAARHARPAHRPVGHRAPGRRGGDLPRRRAPGHGRTAAGTARRSTCQVVVPVEDMTALGEPTGDLSRAGSGRRAACVDLAARRGARARPRRGAPLDDRLRQLAPAGRAAHRPTERTGLRAGRANRLRPAARATGRVDGRVGRRASRRATWSSPARTTARSRASSGPSSRRTSRPAGCPRSSRRPRSNWASTWVRSTSSCRSRRRRRSRPGCSGSAAPGTRSARSRAA